MINCIAYGIKIFQNRNQRCENCEKNHEAPEASNKTIEPIKLKGWINNIKDDRVI